MKRRAGKAFTIKMEANEEESVLLTDEWNRGRKR